MKYGDTLWDPPTLVSKIKYNAGPHTSTLSVSLFLSVLFSFFSEIVSCLSLCIFFILFSFVFYFSFFYLCKARFLLWSQAEQNLQSIDVQHHCDLMLWNNTLINMMKHCMTSLGQNFWMHVRSTVPNYLSCYWPIKKNHSSYFLLSSSPLH